MHPVPENLRREHDGREAFVLKQLKHLQQAARFPQKLNESSPEDKLL